MQGGSLWLTALSAPQMGRGGVGGLRTLPFPPRVAEGCGCGFPAKPPSKLRRYVQRVQEAEESLCSERAQSSSRGLSRGPFPLLNHLSAGLRRVTLPSLRPCGSLPLSVFFLSLPPPLSLLHSVSQRGRKNTTLNLSWLAQDRFPADLNYQTRFPCVTKCLSLTPP